MFMKQKYSDTFNPNKYFYSQTHHLYMYYLKYEFIIVYYYDLKNTMNMNGT